MASRITTKQLLRRQYAKSLHTRDQESDALGHPTGNMAIPWVPQCIITDVKIYTSLPKPVNALWILSNSSHTTIKYRLIMAAKYMTDALQNPHPEVPFARVGDNTISALAELAAIFKLKLRQTQPQTLPAAPTTVKHPHALPNHTIHS
jgi:hypothetical protein